MKTYINTWKKTFDYSSRATRTEFWIFSLVNTLLVFALVALEFFLAKQLTTTNIESYMQNSFLNYIGLIFLLPSLSLYVRRLHDLDKSGWQLFIFLVPIIGAFYIGLVTAFFKGTDGDNSYGLDPRDLRN